MNQTPPLICSLFTKPSSTAGFTLIELAIVLVVIGLIVGGILVGRDLIRAAETRATITQLEKFQTATNTFYGKFGYLPGDINAQAAKQFGFVARGTGAGQGDGNGIIQSGNGIGSGFGYGETTMFWVDLSSSVAGNLIEGSFTAASPITAVASVPITALSNYFPPAKLGHGNYFYVYTVDDPSQPNYQTINYYGLSAVNQINTINGCVGCMGSTPGLTVTQAYNIDKKIDDGLPQSGNVLAFYLNANLSNTSPLTIWAAGGGNEGNNAGQNPTTNATQGTSSTCYDNGNAGGAIQQYSLGQANGAYVNCALSFKFQ